MKNDPNLKKGRSSKTILLITLLVLIPFFIIFIVGFVVILIKLDIFSFTNENNRPSEPEKPIIINPNPDDSNLPKDKFENRPIIGLESLTKEDWENDKNYKINNGVIEYTDPINGIIFKDVSYNYNEDKKNPRYFLGKEGLALLAKEFYSKVPFGPEIVHLKSISINDYNVISDSSAGLYLPQINEIYLNSKYMIEKNYDIFTKIINLMGPLFHEYTHHWASSYVNYGPVTKNDITEVLSYRPSKNSISDDYWNKYFVNNYLENLNYNYTNVVKPEYATQNNFLPSILSLNNLWKYSNIKSEYDVLYKEFVKRKLEVFSFALNPEYSKYSNIITNYKLDQIPYYYSMTELVPREWQKFTYIPYYVQGDIEGKHGEKPYSKKYKRNETTTNIFEISQNYYGEGVNYFDKFKDLPTDQTYQFGSYASDWARTLKYGSTMVSVEDLSLTKYDDYIYPNSVWGLKFNYINPKTKETGVQVFEDKHRDFYKRFLESMFYGKPFAQIKSKITKISDKQFSPKEAKSFKITGYLEENNWEYLVYYNKKLKLTKIPIKYINYHNFNVKDFANARTRDLKPKDVIPELKEKYFIYQTDWFNSEDVSYDRPIFFARDLNNNGTFEVGSGLGKNSDEVWMNFSSIDNPIPNNRILMSSDYNFFKDNLGTNKILYFDKLKSNIMMKNGEE
ncbi:Uncharacterised protein [Mycoplasmopsis maculosa]|uniref:Uncharacterized protein n=1 Tax=Mycoplasmopsis maculosa TaxID=114885 RepID=A0A449B4N5_9BACT|nr:hypothetical protein [Mycoplasmopsis maculosa]VEU75573.1 Uncharacterised protein [Mycoplasmopsis maculosa]